jgi:TRAP transporter 4TM/12TM fusion protein
MKRIEIATAIVGVGTFLYHMVYTQYLVQNTVVHMNTHLGLALLLVFLGTLQKTKRTSWRISLYILLFLAVLGATYVQLNAEELQDRAWFNTSLDLVIGAMLIFLVLEATRESFGIFVPVLAILTVIYPFFGEHFPEPFYSTSLPIKKTIANLSVCLSRGIYGTALSVSATYIFLWVVFGSVLQATGGVRFFMQVGRLICSRLRSGPAMMAIVTSSLVGMVTGSTSANIAITGSFTIPLMKKIGFRPEQAGAIEATASNGGQIMPPIMGVAAFAMAGITGIPYLKIATIAIIPAIFYFFTCGVYVVLMAERLRIAHMAEKVDLKELLLSGPLFIVPLAIIVILFLLDYTVMFVSFWAISSAIVLSLIRKETRPSLGTLINGLTRGAIAGAQIAVMCACVGLIVTTFTMTGLGVEMTSGIEIWSGGSLLIALVIISSICIVMGLMGITLTAYLIVSMFAVPALMKMGVDLVPAHFFVLFVSIFAFVTPPIAIGALVASRLAGGTYVKTAIEACKINGANFVLPLLFIYCPFILLQPQELPELLGGIAATLIIMTTIPIGIVGYFRVKLGLIEKVLSFIAALISILYVVFQNYMLLGGAICIFLLLSMSAYSRARRVKGIAVSS